MKLKRNPKEQMVEDLAQYYVERVMRAAEHIAPRQPWWFVELSPDAQLWRWMEMREPIVTWLAEVAAYLPEVETYEDLMDQLEFVFTGRIEDIVPPPLLVDERSDTLKELVQAAGPEEAAKHIRKMERLVAQRAAANQVLDSARQEALGGLDLEEQLRLSAPVSEPEGVPPAY